MMEMNFFFQSGISLQKGPLDVFLITYKLFIFISYLLFVI